MRIDKWLWSMRIYKTRSIAADACKNNRISIGNSVTKASREVKIGDEVKVKKMPVIYSYKIIDLPKSRQGAANVPLFMRNTTPKSELDKLEQKISIFISRDRGTGRPTKKERREIDSVMGANRSDFDDLEWDDELDSIEEEEIEEEDLGDGYKSKKTKSKKVYNDDDFDFNF